MPSTKSILATFRQVYSGISRIAAPQPLPGLHCPQRTPGWRCFQCGGCGSVRLNVLDQAPEIIQLSTDDGDKTEQGDALQEIPKRLRKPACAHLMSGIIQFAGADSLIEL
jgi:hypothetical protein